MDNACHLEIFSFSAILIPSRSVCIWHSVWGGRIYLWKNLLLHILTTPWLMPFWNRNSTSSWSGIWKTTVWSRKTSPYTRPTPDRGNTPLLYSGLQEQFPVLQSYHRLQQGWSRRISLRFPDAQFKREAGTDWTSDTALKGSWAGSHVSGKAWPAGQPRWSRFSSKTPCPWWYWCYLRTVKTDRWILLHTE